MRAARDQATGHGAINELDGAVVLDLQLLRQIADVCHEPRRHAFDSQQQPVLLGVKASLARIAFAESQKAAHLIAKFRQCEIVALADAAVGGSLPLGIMSCHDVISFYRRVGFQQSCGSLLASHLAARYWLPVTGKSGRRIRLARAPAFTISSSLLRAAHYRAAARSQTGGAA